MKNINPLGFFDEHFLLERLTKLKDLLVKLEAHIDRNSSVQSLRSRSTSPLIGTKWAARRLIES